MKIIEYLNTLGVRYRTHGKNIGTGWVGLEECPHCSDKRYHLGINTESGNYSCWVCGEKGGLRKLVMVLEGISYAEAGYRIGVFSEYNIQEEDVSNLSQFLEAQFSPKSARQRAFPTIMHLTLPPHLTSLIKAAKTYPSVRFYLKQRGFTEEDWKQWDAYYCYKGKLVQRIIFPITLKGKVVNYVARAIGKAEKRYLNCPKEEAVIPLSHCLYNIDKVRQGDEVVIVEGVMDALKVEKVLGKRAVAIFSKIMKPSQILLLIEKGVEKVEIMLDRDAWDDAIELGARLTQLMSCPVETIYLTTVKDPGELNGTSRTS